MGELPAAESIRELRDKGLQVTQQRLAIYEVLKRSNEHPSAEMIFQRVRKRFPRISLGTVYKTLECFCNKGLSRKLNALPEVGRYEASKEPHHHFICIHCHRIEDVSISPTQEWHLPHLPAREFLVLHRQVQFHGICPDCQRR